MLRRVGDLTRGEVAERVLDGIDAVGLLAELERERRAIRLRVGGEERYVAADEAGLYRDALSAVPPAGLPQAFLQDVPDALAALVGRFARTHGPFTTEELRSRYGVDASAVLRELERSGALVRGELRPGGTDRDWCDVEVLRRLRRASLAALRKEIEPADRRSLAAFLPSWQGVDRHPAAGAGIDRLREVLAGLQGMALPVEMWERDVLPRRTGAYSPAWLDSLCASGEVVWVGAAPPAGGSTARRTPSGRVALYFREDAPTIGPPMGAPGRAGASPPAAAEHELLRARLAQGPCFFTDLLAELDAPAEALRVALWDLVWAGEATNDAWAPLRAPHLTLARGARAAGARDVAAGRPSRSMVGRPRFRARDSGRARPGRPARPTGAGPLVAHRGGLPRRSTGSRRAPARAVRAAARALRHRHPRAGARRGDQGGVCDAV